MLFAKSPTGLTSKRLGVQKIVILTGDHERVAKAIAKVPHADEVRAGLLPDQKVVELRHLAESPFLRCGGAFSYWIVNVSIQFRKTLSRRWSESSFSALPSVNWPKVDFVNNI